MDKVLLIIGFGLLVIRSVYWVYSVWEKGSPEKRVFVSQVGELVLLLFFLTQITGLSILPMPVSFPSLPVGFFLVLIGVGLSFVGKRELGKNWSYAGSNNMPKELITTGIYKYLRHPIYSGYVFSFVGIELLLGSWLWISFLALLIPFYRHVKREEKRLEKQFGKRYRDYKKNTTYFIPFVW